MFSNFLALIDARKLGNHEQVGRDKKVVRDARDIPALQSQVQVPSIQSDENNFGKGIPSKVLNDRSRAPDSPNQGGSRQRNHRSNFVDLGTYATVVLQRYSCYVSFLFFSPVNFTLLRKPWQIKDVIRNPSRTTSSLKKYKTLFHFI